METETSSKQSSAKEAWVLPLDERERGPEDISYASSQGNNESRKAQYQMYNIAWICALPIEMAAARMMLDKHHEDLPTLATDSNTYILGNIGHHNIVVASLPEYGTNNAAAVLTNLKRTFPSVRVSLMVGIGGGAPNTCDVRLGDVVVGTRVMQYDMGKLLKDGQMQRTAQPRIIHQILGTAVSALRSKHELEPSKIPSILKERTQRYPGYHHPNSPDCLFQSTYHHPSDNMNCDECDGSRLVTRRTRPSHDPTIHYGAIASGNQVMKNGVERDKIARELDVLCFEMEAAGVMDILPCLPIRGISDYSDSHKNKEWQRYAAAVAAAYAREFLSVFPRTENHVQTRTIPSSAGSSIRRKWAGNPGLQVKIRAQLLETLSFTEITSRQETIQPAHAKTCQWICNHRAYLSWIDPEEAKQHHSFLWISGKPGAGKSTLMKFLYKKTREHDKNRRILTAAFFFNARGNRLGKSIVGMYRSLIIQLFKGFPDLQIILDPIVEDIGHEIPNLQASETCTEDICKAISKVLKEWTLESLKETFAKAISSLGRRSFICFIDALDECDEQQVIEMVRNLENIAELSASCDISLRICFSSRHYPYIDIQRGIRITLEDQQGHRPDLSNYVESRLRVDGEALYDLRVQILNKAGGVFLWVALVVEILNKEHRQGRLSMKQRLAELPGGLSELFKNIVMKDNENMEDLFLCIIWILYAERPLNPDEYYHALWSGLKSKGLVAEIPKLTFKGSKDTISRYVTSSSKGLAELTKSAAPTIQFIHESVKDFLVKNGGIYELWPDMGLEWQISSHETLKLCCYAYLYDFWNQYLPEDLTNLDDASREEIDQHFPFLEYACENVLYHAEAAADVIQQHDFMSQFPFSKLTETRNNMKWPSRRRYHAPFISQLRLLATIGLPKLVTTRLDQDPKIDFHSEEFENSFFDAVVNRHQSTIAALLSLVTDIDNGIRIAESLKYNRLSPRTKDRSMLSRSSRRFRISARTEGRSMLSWAAQEDQYNLVILLLQQGLFVDEMDKHSMTPLARAIEMNNVSTADILLENGASPNVNTSNGGTLLTHAISDGFIDMTQLLLERGANPNQVDMVHRTPLEAALSIKNEYGVKLLIDYGADPNRTFSSGHTPLSVAISRSQLHIANILIGNGAHSNVPDKDRLYPGYKVKAHR